MTNWNWLTATGLVLALSACGSTSVPAAPPASSAPTSSSPTSSAPSSSTPPATANDWQRTDGVVTKISDGDTVHVTSAGRGEETVRALGADTPETRDPRKPVQCGGLQATQFAKDTLLGQAVHLVSDPTQGVLDVKTGRYVDRYRRTLAYIELVKDGSDYSTLVTEAGLARAYIYDRKRPPQRIAQIQAAEMRAHNAYRGIWGPLCVQTQ